jgi:DNA-binding transcriptional ArsR family regulator
MVKLSPPPLDAVFGALADPTRRAILVRLTGGDVSTSELAEPFDMSLVAVSKHLSVLERAGLVERRKDGRVRRCRLVADPLRDAVHWMERYRVFWEGQFDRLATYLGEETEEE